jgi:hypothetical protein
MTRHEYEANGLTYHYFSRSMKNCRGSCWMGTVLFATAAALYAIGWVAPTGPAQAVPSIPLAPPVCAQFSFGFTTLDIRDIPMTFTGDGPHVDTTATLPSVQGVAQQGHLSGGVDQNGHVDLTMTAIGGGGTASHFVGDVGADGTASGTVTGPGDTSNPWHTTAPLKCEEQAQPAVPTDAIVVNVHQTPINVTVDVQNTSTTPGDCTYDAKPTDNPFLPPVHRDFHLNASPAKGSSTGLDFLAPPLGATYHLVISCKADGQQMGHFEQDVTGSV